MNYFIHYWDGSSRSEIRYAARKNKRNSFKGRVLPGDIVFILNVKGRELYLRGAIEVDQVTSNKETVSNVTGLNLDEILGNNDCDYVLPEKGQVYPFRDDLRLSCEEVETRVSFVKETEGNKCDANSYRSLRALSKTTGDYFQERLGLVSSDFVSYPGEDLLEDIKEGQSRAVLVNKYERNRKLREQCISYYGAQCMICNFNFGRIYGPKGNGFIHVHHLNPLGNKQEEHSVDPIKDLIPLCPNCHAMVHTRKNPYSVEDIKEGLTSKFVSFIRSLDS